MRHCLRSSIFCALFLGLYASQTSPVALHVIFLDAGGNPIHDMRAEEIILYDSGHPVESVQVTGPEKPFDVGLLLDVSPSTHDNVDVIRNETASFFHSLPESTQAMILTFDSQIYVDCDWTTDRKLIDEAIFEFGLHKPGSTSVVYEALVVALEQKYVERGARQALIFFTDAREIGSQDVSRQESLEVVRDLGVLLYPIHYDSRAHYRKVHSTPTDPTRMPPARLPQPSGTNPGGIFIGSGPTSERDWTEYKVQQAYQRSLQYMQEAARAGRGPFNAMSSPDHLREIYNRVRYQLNNSYTLRFMPRHPRGSGQLRTVQVKTTRKDAVVQVITKGYWSR